MKNSSFINKIICGDSIAILGEVPENSIDLVLTDPPYFLDKLDDKWSHKTVSNKRNQQTIKSLPAGMKFDREQGKRFYSWYLEVSKKILRVLKPGGFFFSFSSPRLYHRMASAVDDAGFFVRDCFVWLYTQNQAKAMGLNHFIEKMKIDSREKDKIKMNLDGWKTPQVKSCFEPLVMAQKSLDGTFLNNILKHDVGLVNTKVKIGEGMFPANAFSSDNISEEIDKVFLISKPSKTEKGVFNTHSTVKPVSICEYLISLTTKSNDAIVLDPFVGSGTTAVAAKKLGRKYLGIDLNSEYVDISRRRLELVEASKISRSATKDYTASLF